MLIHEYNNRNRKLKKNPFLEEGTLVFQNGDPNPEGGGGGADDQQDPDDNQTPPEEQPEQTPEPAPQPAPEPAPEPLPQEDIDRWLAPSYQNATTTEDMLVRDIHEMVPGQRPYTPETAQEIEHNWGQMMTEYNGVQTYVDHFTRLRNHVMSPAFDPNEERWRGHGVGQLYRSFGAIEQVRGFKLSRKSKRNIERKKRQEVDASKEQIARDLADIITGLERARGKMLDAIEKQMRQDFSARIKWLDKQWATNPPPQYTKKQVQDYRRQLRDAKRRINETLPHFFENNDDHQARIREYAQIYEDIKNQELQYEENHGDGHEAENTSYEDLDAYYDKLVRRKKDEIDPIASAYVSKVDQRAAEVRNLIEEVRTSKLYENDEKTREEDIKELEKILENLTKSRNISDILNDALDNNDDVMVTNDEGEEVPLQMTFEDGSKHTFKKGLRQQLDFLNDPRLSDKEKGQFAVGINEAFEQFEKDLDNTKVYFENDLDIIRDNTETQRRSLHPPEAKNKRFKVKWFSAYDTVRAFEIIAEWSKRRYQRAATQRVGQFGSKLLAPLAGKYNPITPLRTLPNEFDKEVEKSEQEEVNQYKEIYANKDMWEVEEFAWNTRNQDELKACMYLLAENGRLRWDNDKLLGRLMHFQDKVTFLDANTEIQDISGFYEKIKRAIGFIWDFDTFNQMKNQNSSAYDSKKQEYEQNCHEWAESAGGLNKVLRGMLKAHKEKGRAAKIDPILYEKIVEYCIFYGKIGPEEKLYYLIQGIATGLLAPDRGSVINSGKINDYPSIDWFGSETKRGEKPTLEDIQEVAQYNYRGFIHWYHTVAMTCPRVTQRVDKTLTQGNKLDHDDLVAFLAYMSESTTETMLGKNTDGFRLPLTGIQNGTVSMMFYMDHMAENYKTMSGAAESMVRFIGSFTRYDAITMNRMYRDQGANYFRWDTSTYNQKPRAAGAYNDVYGRGPEMTAKSHMTKVRKYLEMLDPTFFGALYNYDRSEMTNDKAKEIAQELVDRYGTDAVFEGDVPKTVDELYQSIGKFARYIIENNPSAMSQMFEKIKSDHSSSYSKYKKHLTEADSRIQKMRRKRRARQPVRMAEGASDAVMHQPPPAANNNDWFGSAGQIAA